MKKLIALIMALTMIATFAACGTTENEKKDPVETTEDKTISTFATYTANKNFVATQTDSSKG